MFKGARAIPHQIVDVFSISPFSGNAAGVVTNASSLNDEEMQNIARELNISNTSFLLKPQKDGDLKIRYFCPESEINMCGHATIGSIFAWGENHLKDKSKNPKSTIKIETKVGTLDVNIRCKKGNIEEVGVTLPNPEFYAAGINRKRLFDALNINESMTIEEYPVEIVNSGLSFIEVGIKDQKSLLNIKPQFRELQRITEEMNIDSVQIFTLDTFDDSSTVLSRTFFPRYGVNEDPVCGTGNAAVASYLIHNGIIGDTEEKIRIIGEQGHSVSRPGKVYVDVECKHDKINNLIISGSAALVFEGHVFLK